jgi:hypothetical protein
LGTAQAHRHPAFGRPQNEFPFNHGNLKSASVLGVKMNHETPTPTPTPEPPKRHRLKALIGVLATGLTVVVLVLALRGRSSPGLVWMTPADFARATHGGILTQLKYKVVRLLGPVARWFPRSKTQIDLSATLVSLSSNSGEVAVPGLSVGTNADGMVAWILAEREFGSLMRQLKTNAGVSVMNQARITTSDRGQAQVFNGVKLPQTGSTTWVGTRIDVLPKVTARAIRLLVALEWTEALQPPVIVGVRTNFTTSCSAVVPNAGSLVILGSDVEKRGGRNCLLIVRPTATDSLGRRIKL